MSGPTPQIIFPEAEWHYLVEFLRDCPGRLSVVFVPGPPAGDALINRLPYAINPLSVNVASENATPTELAGRALELHEQDQVFLIPLDGRHSLGAEDEAQQFWEAMNYQREVLSTGRLRTCLILDERNDQLMMRHADDLREWAHIFRFPDAVPFAETSQSSPEPSPTPSPGEVDAEVDIEVLQDQLRRARAAGSIRAGLRHPAFSRAGRPKEDA